jgi:hypothetical protein
MSLARLHFSALYHFKAVAYINSGSPLFEILLKPEHEKKSAATAAIMAKFRVNFFIFQ